MNQKLKQVPLGPIGKYWLSHSSILKLTQHSTKESQLYSSIL